MTSDDLADIKYRMETLRRIASLTAPEEKGEALAILHSGMPPQDDIAALLAEVERLRTTVTKLNKKCQDAAEAILAVQNQRDALYKAIVEHYVQKADDRCWADDEKLYAAAGLGPVDRTVGDKTAMLENCKRFLENRCDGGGPWKSYAELEAENKKLRDECDSLRTVILATSGPPPEVLGG